jgi:Lrp/AsnC family leucine-responsive transcriptional regulator
MIDEIDKKILMYLQINARMSNAEIARKINMAPSAVFERIKNLEKKQIIKGYEVKIDPVKLGLNLVVFVFLTANEAVFSTDTGRLIEAIPEVQEVHLIAGEDCYLVKVRAKDTEDLTRILRNSLGKIKSIKSSRTTLVLSTVKESSLLPIPSEIKSSSKK